MQFKFDNFTTKVHITNELPKISLKNALFVCDENTKYIAEIICENSHPICVLKSGEENKKWQAIETILLAAKDAGLGRDGNIIGVGGGVIGDLAGFASSIYMRGCKFQLVATTLLAMVDASVGGKTGFDLFDIKNFAGTFYPAENVYIPLDALKTLPEKEMKSGMAELIKTEILNSSRSGAEAQRIKNAIKYKAKIVSSDFKETKGKRALLNLGHTFGHALETAAGLGNITHGEAVAWGMVQACYLGVALNITPIKRAKEIITLIKSYNYDCSSPHPLANTEIFKNALVNDKKKSKGTLSFVVPNKKSAQVVKLDNTKILDSILQDGYIL